jgi:hypothetical protein
MVSLASPRNFLQGCAPPLNGSQTRTNNFRWRHCDVAQFEGYDINRQPGRAALLVAVPHIEGFYHVRPERARSENDTMLESKRPPNAWKRKASSQAGPAALGMFHGNRHSIRVDEKSYVECLNCRLFSVSFRGLHYARGRE